MSSSSDLVTARKYIEQSRYTDAIRILKDAAETCPTDETIWHSLIAAAADDGQHGYSAGLCRQALHHHPSSDWIWLKLGTELLEHDQLDEAETALSNARRLNPHAPWLWRNLATLYRKRKNYSQEIEALEYLKTLDEADSHDLNSLGLAYRELKHFGKAIELFHAAAALKLDTTSLLHLASVFTESEVSQDADASDAYQRILFLNPNHNLAKARLSKTKLKLLPLAEKARNAARTLVSPDSHYRFYISPFEMLQIDGHQDCAELDIKSVQRGKKRLLQEIELNDGKVGWLSDYALDRSRALRLVVHSA